ncbi:MAG: hypothetical protein LQ345_000317 [Seirophora villosa]|nr:MAG: hypothetical protein LQ345_000317 [Seirophora villosa]
MHSLVPLVLRALQLLFAIILLGMTGYLVNTTTVNYDGYSYIYRSPSEVAFMLFSSVWTLVPALPYLALGPRFLPASANNKVIHLAVDALTALFWFAGFIALAAWSSSRLAFSGLLSGTFESSSPRPMRKFSSLADLARCSNRLLFTATTVLNGLDFNRNRNSTSAVQTAPETTTV